MKVLLINGSPHKDGCTYTALKEVSDALATSGVESEWFHIGKKPIGGCIACYKCVETGKCILPGDEVNNCVELLKACDGVVVGSPVYYAAPNASLLGLLARAFFYKSAPYANKPAASIVSCRRAGSSASLEVLNKYFAFASMPLVSSVYWNMVHGNKPEEVQQDLEGLQTMRMLGKNMAWLLKCIEAGKTAGVPLPEKEEKIWTNFIG